MVKKCFDASVLVSNGTQVEKISADVRYKSLF